MKGDSTMAQIVCLDSRNKKGFFDETTLSYLLPEIRLVSEIQKMDSVFTQTGLNFVFKIFLTHGIDVEFGFETEKEAIDIRRDIIMAMMQFWGPDQMIFSNGLDYEVTFVTAVEHATTIFKKGGRFIFSLMIECVPYPVNLVFIEMDQAEKALNGIHEKREFYLRSSNTKLKSLAVN
jgi:hypothetical protein